MKAAIEAYLENHNANPKPSLSRDRRGFERRYNGLRRDETENYVFALHGLAKKRYLVAREERDGLTARKLYRASFGLEALAVTRAEAMELFGAIMSSSRPSKKKARRNGR